jgi:TatD DNase family protein
VIDFHCHLDLYPDPKAVIQEVARRQIYTLAVTTTPRAFDGNLQLVGESKRIRVAVGLHPELVAERKAEADLVCRHMERTRYVGEIGMDGSPQHKASIDDQRAVLRQILTECRRQGGKIISLHSRMATSDVMDEISSAGQVGIPVMHWFSGNEKELERAIAIGCWFSVGPAMLAGQKGRRIAGLMPRDRILPETDGPFCQIKGRALMPWDSNLVLVELEKLWGLSCTEAKNTVILNLKNLTSNEATL